MEDSLRQLLRELETYGREHDAREAEHSRKLLNLEPGTAQLLSILLRSSGSHRVLEIGTSNGYSTIWLAWSLSQSLSAARVSGAAADGAAGDGARPGSLISIERKPEKQALARENLRRAGFAEREDVKADVRPNVQVDLLLGDATEVIRELPGPFDFVFFDADRFGAPVQLRLLLPKLAGRAFVLHDNALSHPREIAAYLAMMEGLPDFQHTIVPVGKGLSVAYRG
jgi:predicted O-methyltransferase YrrM